MVKFSVSSKKSCSTNRHHNRKPNLKCKALALFTLSVLFQPKLCSSNKKTLLPSLDFPLDGCHQIDLTQLKPLVLVSSTNSAH